MVFPLKFMWYTNKCIIVNVLYHMLLIPTSFSHYCNHHQVTFTRMLIKYNKLLPYYIRKTTSCYNECLKFFYVILSFQYLDLL